MSDGLVDLRSYRTLDEATDEELIELAPGETSLHFSNASIAAFGSQWREG
jgi:hypothetical protein